MSGFVEVDVIMYRDEAGALLAFADAAIAHDVRTGTLPEDLRGALGQLRIALERTLTGRN